MLSENASALHLVLTGDPTLYAIVRLSLSVSVSAVLLAAVIGLPLGALVALTRFRGREFVVVLLNALAWACPPSLWGFWCISPCRDRGRWEPGDCSSRPKRW